MQAALDMMANWRLEQLPPDLPRLASPLLLVACSEDMAVPPASAFHIRDLVPGSRVEYVRGLGHLAHEECPADIANIILAAWDSGATRPLIASEARKTQ